MRRVWGTFVPLWVTEDATLTPATRAVLLVIAAACDGKPSPVLRVEDMMRAAHTSRSSACRAVVELERRGLIVVERHRVGPSRFRMGPAWAEQAVS